MKLEANYRAGILYIQLQGEVDEHGVSTLRREADRWIDNYAQRCAKVVFDLKEISFMDNY